MTKVIMMCAPARAGKDTILPILMDQLRTEYGGQWKRFAFADKLKQDCEERIQDEFGVSVWDDTQKHLFRQVLIEYGMSKRDETAGNFLIDHFFDQLEKDVNYIISDYRFINEYHMISNRGIKTGKYSTHPIYIERFIELNGLVFELPPVIPQEVKNYPLIKSYAKIVRVKYYTCKDWQVELALNKYEIISL
jgi:hypothetical protein